MGLVGGGRRDRALCVLVFLAILLSSIFRGGSTAEVAQQTEGASPPAPSADATDTTALPSGAASSAAPSQASQSDQQPAGQAGQSASSEAPRLPPNGLDASATTPMPLGVSAPPAMPAAPDATPAKGAELAKRTAPADPAPGPKDAFVRDADCKLSGNCTIISTIQIDADQPIQRIECLREIG